MINEYISDFCNGTIPQSLIDEVGTLYEKISVKDRIQLVSGLGEMNADFDWIDVNQCYLLLNDLKESKRDCKEFVELILPVIERIKEDEIYYELVENIDEYCHQLIENTMSELDFKDEMNRCCEQLDRFYYKE